MGEVLTVTCNACGEVMPSGLRACGECGSPLTPADAPAASAPVPAPDMPVASVPDMEIPEDSEPSSDPLPASSEVVTDDTPLAAPAPAPVPVPADEHDPLEVFDAAERPRSGSDAKPSAVGALFSARPSRRKVLILSAIGAASVLGVFGTAVAVGAGLSAGAVGAPDARPRPSATPTGAATVTLPGYAVTPVWSANGVDAAAVTAQHVLTVAGSTCEWRVAGDGEIVATAEISGSDVRVISGFVSGTSAAAVVSDTQALVWVDGENTPLPVALDGRALEVRSGGFVIAGPNRSFWVVTETGEVPVSAPRPEAIVLGVTGDGVVWASAGNRVSVASANGTVLSETVLAPPAKGATITPRTGWVRAVSTATVVVGWTLPDGTQTTGVHQAASGALASTIPGAGDGVLSPAGDLWMTDGHLVDLVDATVTAFPDGFAASRFLGRAVFGATTDGSDALLVDDTIKPAPTAPTVRAIAAAGDGTLLTLTGGELAAFLPTT